MRFLLRWPSRHLCHLTNRIRHAAFGLSVAGRLAEDHLEQVQLLGEMRGGEEGGSETRSGGMGEGVKEVREEEAEVIAGGSVLMQEVWAAQGAAASGRHVGARVQRQQPSPDSEGAADNGAISSVSEGTTGGEGGEAMHCVPMRVVEDEGGRKVRYVVPEEPLVPRPIVSIHVRQGDKGHEMRLMSFRAFMLAAHRLRAHQPFLKHVWLSTEMQVRG